MFVEYEGAPYHCLDVEVSTPTARGGQTLVRVKMRNLITRNVSDRTFRAGDKLGEPDLVKVPATFQYADALGFHFMDQETYETLTLGRDTVGDDRLLITDNLEVSRFTSTTAIPSASSFRRMSSSRSRPPSPPCEATRRVARRRRPSSTPAWKSACRSSSRKATACACTRKHASSPDAPEAAMSSISRSYLRVIVVWVARARGALPAAGVVLVSQHACRGRGCAASD